MAILVEHDKRKKEILSKSLDLFIEEGYEDVTFQKIADRCGITRTTLYIYFKNKREVFLWSIKQLTENLEQEILRIISNKNLSSIECLQKMFSTILDECEANDKLFKILLVYLVQLQKSGADPEVRVNRRVIRMQHLLSTIVIRGQKKGEIKNIPVKQINGLLYSLIESAIFRLSVMGKSKIPESKEIIRSAIEMLKANQVQDS